jgi:hypothetical protein
MKPGLKGILAGTLGLLGALSSVNADAAVDSKIYPGSMCRVANSTVGSITYSTSSTGYLQNYPGTVGVSCPVVRDQIAGTTPASAWVSIHDAASTSSVWCALYSANSVAGTISYKSDWTSDAFKGDVVLVMTNVPTGSGWWDSLNIKCSVPENARLYSYAVDETIQSY